MSIGRPRAARENPMAFLLICHCVTQQSDQLNSYHRSEARNHGIHAGSLREFKTIQIERCRHV
jgi:hypothetical protein